VLPVKTMSVLRTGDDGALCVMSLLGASSWDTSRPPLLVLASASLPPPSGLPGAICAIVSAAVAAIRAFDSVVPSLEVGSLVKTMSSARTGDVGVSCVMVPLEGVVLGLLHAYGGRPLGCCLLVLL